MVSATDHDIFSRNDSNSKFLDFVSEAGAATVARVEGWKATIMSLKNVVLFAVLAQSLFDCVEGNTPDFDQDLSDYLVQMDNASSPAAMGEVYMKLFANRDLANLRSCENRSIAIEAAWRSYCISVDQKPHFGMRPIRRDVIGTARFVGFLEGRMSVNVPRWWEQFLQSPDQHHPKAEVAISANWITPPNRRSLIPNGNSKIEDTQRGVTFDCSNALLDWILKSASDRRIAVFDAPPYVALISESVRDSVPRMAIILKSSGRESLRGELWGATKKQVYGSTGPKRVDNEYIDFAFDGSSVTVFGASSRGVISSNKGFVCGSAQFFIEQFSRDTGKPLARFSSTYYDETTRSK